MSLSNVRPSGEVDELLDTVLKSTDRLAARKVREHGGTSVRLRKVKVAAAAQANIPRWSPRSEDCDASTNDGVISPSEPMELTEQRHDCCAVVVAEGEVEVRQTVALDALRIDQGRAVIGDETSVLDERR
jgi:hypothetical protein